jgi:transcription antitermination factor NusG
MGVIGGALVVAVTSLHSAFSESDSSLRGSVTTFVLPWFGLRLRSNFEQTTSRQLEYRGYEVFLPTYRTRTRRSDRVKEIRVPLFAGYVFCRIDINHRLPVLTTPGVIGIVGLGKIPEPIADREIAAVRAIAESPLFSQPWPFLQTGDRILVEHGPLAGTEGILSYVKGEYRLIATISLLQRSVAVELDRDWVRPVERSLRSSVDGAPRSLCR